MMMVVSVLEPVSVESPLRANQLGSLQRCNSFHSVQSGSWIGTLVCCVRQHGHPGDHSVPLGDVGAPHYWLETWR
jgi:hypothetical protein